MSDYRLHLNSAPITFERAKSLRAKLTLAEKTLWPELRNRRLKGMKFRRQHPLNGYIADFYCHECLLVIELDGGIHQMKAQKEYDERRTFELKEYGIKVLRFKNEEVLGNISGVLNEIKKHLVI